MAAIFNIVAPGEDIVTRLATAAVETVVHRLVPEGPADNKAVKAIGGIVTAAGFPEFGIPIMLAGHLVGRWFARPAAGPAR